MAHKSTARLRYDYQSEKDICLNCELYYKYGLDCVHDFGGPPLDQCPIEQFKKKPGPQVPPGYMSLSEVKRELGIGYKRLQRMVKTGQCPAQKCGHSQRAVIAIPVEWVEAQKS